MSQQQSDYKIELDNYSGPLDLLLYLIRRDELDVYDIPIARITEQYMKYLDVISELNINVAGEFVVMAATLMEIKSRMMAPKPEEGADEEEMEDPRLDLVRQLMAYKRFKEAALELNDRAAERAKRFTRPGERVDGTLGPNTSFPTDLNIWTLVEAFSRILEQTGRRGPHRVTLDDVPQEALRQRLEDRVRAAGRLSFASVFEGDFSRMMLIGMFLAVLELVKQQVLRVEQEEAFGEIRLTFVPEHERIKYEDEPAPGAEDEDPFKAPAFVDEPRPEDKAAWLDDWDDEDDDALGQDDLNADLPDAPEIDEAADEPLEPPEPAEPAAAPPEQDGGRPTD